MWGVYGSPHNASVEGKIGFFNNDAPCISQNGQINPKNWPKYMKWTLHKTFN